ncbi:MAG: cadherin domain-containing protein, partial [Bacteroidales bacterium]|nr:cadherin domain-containing protein [Bacteroidales bacterium]
MTLSVNWNNKLWINTLFSGFILILLIILAFPLHAQQIKILPLGNSITYDTIVTDARPMGIKTSYRYRLYNLLSSNGYNFDFIGSESTGADSLPAGFADHAGFPGITTSQLLTLLQTGRNYVVDPVNGFCELPFCNQNYLTYYKPDVILLHIGTNDLSLGTAEATVITSLINILNEIDAYEASVGNTVPVILCQIINRMGPLASGNHLATSNYNDLMATMVASRPADEIILVNMEDNAGIDYRPVADGGDMVDTWHPAYSGYYKMGQLFYNQINTYDFTPVLDNATISINENLPNGTTVNTLSGRDFDPGTSLTYSKISGSTAFDVATNGAITVANSAALDYETTPQFTISVRVSDGAKTDDATITINLNNVNEAPALSNPGATVSFTEGNSPVQLTSTITVSDIDNTQLQGATIQITGNFQSGEDVLSFTSANGITGSYSSGTLTLSGTAALANYQTALRSVTYSNTSENPNTSARTVTFTVNDGVLPSNSVSKNITVLGTNDAPVLANIETGTISYTEGDGQVQVT